MAIAAVDSEGVEKKPAVGRCLIFLTPGIPNRNLPGCKLLCQQILTL